MKTAFRIQFVTNKDRVKQFADYIPFKKNYCLRIASLGMNLCIMFSVLSYGYKGEPAFKQVLRGAFAYPRDGLLVDTVDILLEELGMD